MINKSQFSINPLIKRLWAQLCVGKSIVAYSSFVLWCVLLGGSWESTQRVLYILVYLKLLRAQSHNHKLLEEPEL